MKNKQFKNLIFRTNQMKKINQKSIWIIQKNNLIRRRKEKIDSRHRNWNKKMNKKKQENINKFHLLEYQ